MRKITLLSFSILFVFALSAQAQNSCKTKSIRQLAKDFGKAFETKELAKLDATKPFVNQITVRTENSLAQDEKSTYEYKNVNSFTQFGKWLKSKEIDELPGHSVGNLTYCKKGVCGYKINGLLHNTLFLQKISYGYKKDGCPYIKSVFIVDGN